MGVLLPLLFYTAQCAAFRASSSRLRAPSTAITAVAEAEAVTVSSTKEALSLDDAALLCARGWVEIEGWLTPEESRALRNDAATLRDAGRFVRSKIGSRKVDANGAIDSSLSLADETRRSETAWLRPPQPTHLGDVDARRSLDARLGALRSDLSAKTGAPLLDFATEASYAYYPEGGFYKRHVDVPRGKFYELGRSGALGVAELQERREYSILLYLNEAWEKSDGGALRVYDDDILEREILPRLGTLVVLRSDRVPHEVQVANRERWAIVGWFRARRSELEGSPSIGENGAFAAGVNFEARGYDAAALECYNRVTLKSDTENAYLEIRKAHVCFDGLDDLEAAAGHWRAALELERSVVALNGLGLVAAGSSEQRRMHDEALALAPQDAKSASLALSAVNDDALFRRLEEHQPFLASALRFAQTMPVDSNLRRGTRAMLELAFQNAPAKGDILEFGVYHGRSLRVFAGLLLNDQHERELHGFDSFEGLPEAWADEPAASYSFAADTQGGTVSEFPRIGDAILHKGWFSETAQAFFKDRTRPVALVHLDCDLYSSTMDVLTALGLSSHGDVVLLFDDYIGHETWEKDQHAALNDCAQRFGWRLEYVALSLATKQAVVRIVAGDS